KDEKFQKALKIFKAGQFMEKIKKASEKTGINPLAEAQNLITEEKQRLAKENITKAKNREAELVQAVNKAKKEYEDLIAAGEKALELKNNELTNLKQEGENLLSEKENEISTIKYEREQAKDEAIEAKELVEKSNEEKRTLITNLSSIQKKLEKSEEQRNELSGQTITNLQHEVELLQTEVNNYQEKAIEVAKRLKENRTLVSPEKVSLEVLEKERKAHLILIGASQVEIQNKTSRLNFLKTDIENLKQEAANLGKVIRTKRSETFDLVKKLNKAHNLMTELERELAETRAEVERLKEEKEHLEEEKKNLVAKIEKRENKISEKDKELVRLRYFKSDNEDKVNAYDDLKKELANQRIELGKRKNERNISQLTTEKATLRTENQTLQGQLQVKNDELEQAIRQKRLAIFYRIFGRKERNQIKELRTQLQETRTELLLAQNQIRNFGEKVSEIKSLPIIKIDGREKEITGELIIADFPQLEKINVGSNQLTQLHLKNCPQLTELRCGSNKLTELTITNCPNLREIWAYNNQLTNLDLRANTALTNLGLYNNKLTQLDLSNNQQLEILNIFKNNFSSDLSFLSHLVNLKGLYLNNNNFTGSLEPLRNLRKLERLNIDNTNLSQGLEYLPVSVENFYCQGTGLKKELEPFAGD
ncbi:19239_t:CDS:2, partial [Gigaspora margarita]